MNSSSSASPPSNNIHTSTNDKRQKMQALFLTKIKKVTSSNIPKLRFISIKLPSQSKAFSDEYLLPPYRGNLFSMKTVSFSTQLHMTSSILR